MEEKKRVWVAVGVIENKRGDILLAKRSADRHQGDRWEFPGGKVESGEDLLTALDRELWEEIGIRVLDCIPFMELCHDYPEKSVLLDIWKVTRFEGEPYGREGQECCWVPLARLHEYHFPDANAPIVSRLQQGLHRR
ncbi:8-oxo-dGTP diphosphatase MutT [Aeromonas schubertii]|uniref:8-oxo-dGTP diphosphatase n=1 Tax=Aeromonas schubertii TaxID=652 RepID=A0ABS7V945_9GAMM|nr:8-oxo-dGTP diphosphatase MutT [Aeromonas schubertii]MBZ6065443.1 8-oxo-dGTP diphosphatase MutT [Aeromonas schubertii]